MSPLWSWVLTAVGVFGLYIAGRKLWWGWLVNLGSQALWVAYAIVSDQPGFIVGAAAYGTVYGRNALKWWRDR